VARTCDVVNIALPTMQRASLRHRDLQLHYAVVDMACNSTTAWSTGRLDAHIADVVSPDALPRFSDNRMPLGVSPRPRYIHVTWRGTVASEWETPSTETQLVMRNTARRARGARPSDWDADAAIVSVTRSRRWRISTQTQCHGPAPVTTGRAAQINSNFDASDDLVRVSKHSRSGISVSPYRSVTFCLLVTSCGLFDRISPPIDTTRLYDWLKANACAALRALHANLSARREPFNNQPDRQVDHKVVIMLRSVQIQH